MNDNGKFLYLTCLQYFDFGKRKSACFRIVNTDTGGFLISVFVKLHYHEHRKKTLCYMICPRFALIEHDLYSILHFLRGITIFF